MDSKRAAVRQIKAQEAQADAILAVNERLDSIELMLKELVQLMNNEKVKKPAKTAPTKE